MERELDLKTKHLTTLAMSIAQHPNFLNAVGEEIGSAVKESPKKRIAKLQSITRRVRQQSQSEQEWKSFEQQLENLNHDFMAKLGKKFPKLSPTELKICASLKVSLGSKEMASVLCVTIRAIETYRLRIRMKLGLSQSNNLGSSLAIFHENIIRASSFQISLLHRSIVFVAAGFNRRLHVSNQFQSSIGAQYRIEMNRRNMSLRRSFAALDVTILPVETGGYCWRRLFG